MIVQFARRFELNPNVLTILVSIETLNIYHYYPPIAQSAVKTGNKLF